MVYGKKFLLKEDVAASVAGFEREVEELSCQVDAFVVKNSVKLLIKKWFSDIIVEKKKQKPKIKIDKEKCIGCGLCEGICGGLFRMGNDGKAYVKNPNLIIYCVQKAVDKCPSNAITLEKKT